MTMNNQGDDNFELAPDSERLLRLDFGSANPAIARHSNCVFKLDKDSISIIRSKSVNPVGIWLEELPSFKDDPYRIWQGEWPLLESFSRWAEDENQAALSTWKSFGDSNYFQMMIDAYSSVDILRQMLKTSHFNDSISDWKLDMETLPRWVADLGWACVSLAWGELDHGLLVVNDKFEKFLDAFILELKNREKPFAQVISLGKIARWHGPHVL